MADAQLTSSAILQETGGKKIQIAELGKYLRDPKIAQRKAQIIEKYRNPDPKYKDPFYQNAANAMNFLYPTQPPTPKA